MYQFILILSLIAATAWIFWLVKKGRLDKNSSKQVMTESYDSFLKRFHFKEKKYATKFRMLSYQLTLLFIILLVLTGFLPVILTGGHLSGLPLILHVTIAPLFCISLAVFALFWAHALRFVAADRNLFKNKSFSMIFLDADLSDSWQRVVFWLFLVFAVPAILSIVLSMYPVLGPDGQEILLQLHRYTTLFIFVLTLIHITGILRKARPSVKKTGKPK